MLTETVAKYKSRETSFFKEFRVSCILPFAWSWTCTESTTQVFRTRWNNENGDGDQRSAVTSLRSEDSVKFDPAVTGSIYKTRTFVIVGQGEGVCNCL